MCDCSHALERTSYGCIIEAWQSHLKLKCIVFGVNFESYTNNYRICQPEKLGDWFLAINQSYYLKTFRDMSDTENTSTRVGQEIWAAVSVVFCIAVILVFFFILCCAYRRHRRIRDLNVFGISSLRERRTKAFVVENWTSFHPIQLAMRSKQD